MRPSLFSLLHRHRWCLGHGAASIVPIGAQRNAAGGCRVTGRAASGTRRRCRECRFRSRAQTAGVITSSDVDGGYTLCCTRTYLLTAALTGFTSLEQTLTSTPAGPAIRRALSLSLAPRLPLETSKPVAPRRREVPHHRDPAPANGSATTASGRGRGAGETGGDLLVIPERRRSGARRRTPSDTTSTESAGNLDAIAAAARLLDRHAGGCHRDQRQRRKPRSRHDERSLRRDRPRRGRSGDRGGRGGAFGDEASRRSRRPRRRSAAAAARGRPWRPGWPGRIRRRAAAFSEAVALQQNRIFATANYSFGGSALDSRPYQLRGDTPAPTRRTRSSRLAERSAAR